MNEKDTSEGNDWQAVQEQMQKDPTRGMDVQRPAVEDQTYQQLEELREELIRNQDPSFQERARVVLNKLRRVLIPRPKFETTEPEPYGKIVKGQDVKSPQPVTETGKSS